MATLKTITAEATTQPEAEEQGELTAWLNAHLIRSHNLQEAEISGLNLENLRALHQTLDHGQEYQEQIEREYRAFVIDYLGPDRAKRFFEILEKPI